MPSPAADQHVRRTIANMTPEQAQKVLPFFEELLRISAMRVPRRAKFRRVVRLLSRSRKSVRVSIAGLLNYVGAVVKAIPSWRPGFAMSFMMGGALAGAAAFGAHSAGLAAMGTAIALPLWLVTSAGSTMLGVLLDELRRKARSTETPPAGARPDGAPTETSNVISFHLKHGDPSNMVQASGEDVRASSDIPRSA